MIIDRSLFYGKRLLDCFALRQRVKKISYEGNKKGLIVFNTIGCCVADVDAEHYLAYLMALEGYQVKILMDDFQMPHWEYMLQTKAADDYKFHQSLKNKILRGGYGLLSDLIFSHPRIEIIHYSKILEEMYRPIRLTQEDRNHAESSVRKYFQSGEMNLDNQDHRNFFEECLKNVEISKKTAVFIDEKIKPDLYFSSHGFYSTWGPATAYLKDKGYPVIVYYPCPYREQHVLMYENPVHFITRDRSWKAFNKKSLRPDLKALVDGYFANRLKGKSQDNALYYDGFSQHKNVSIPKGPAKVTLGLFPNVIWDGDIVERNTIYKGPVEWILDTISFVEKNPVVHLVLRFHPAEATFHVQSKVLESIIREKVPQLDKIKNITLISSHEKIRTYDLIRDHIDVALVYDGMVGLESAYLGKPVILTAQSRMLGAGVGFEPGTRDEYLRLLSEPEKCVEQFKKGKFKDSLYKFAAWYLFEQCFKLPIFSAKKYAYVEYRPDAKSLDPAFDPEIRRTIGYFNSQIQMGHSPAHKALKARRIKDGKMNLSNEETSNAK